MYSGQFIKLCSVDSGIVKGRVVGVASIGFYPGADTTPGRRRMRVRFHFLYKRGVFRMSLAGGTSFL